MRSASRVRSGRFVGATTSKSLVPRWGTTAQPRRSSRWEISASAMSAPHTARTRSPRRLMRAASTGAG